MLCSRCASEPGADPVVPPAATGRSSGERCERCGALIRISGVGEALSRLGLDESGTPLLDRDTGEE